MLFGTLGRPPSVQGEAESCGRNSKTSFRFARGVSVLPPPWHNSHVDTPGWLLVPSLCLAHLLLAF